MATVQGAELLEVVIDGGGSAKNLHRPGLQRLLGLVESGKVEGVIICQTRPADRSVKDLCSLLELFDKRSVALISVAESLDTASAARTAGHHHHGRGLAVGARDHRRTDAGCAPAQAHQWGAGGEYLLRIPSQHRTASTSNQTLPSEACSRKSVTCARAGTRCEGSQLP